MAGSKPISRAQKNRRPGEETGGLRRFCCLAIQSFGSRTSRRNHSIQKLIGEALCDFYGAYYAGATFRKNYF
jgi:hypothetical protein